MPNLGWGGEIFGGATAGIGWGRASNPDPHPLLRGGNPRFRPLKMGYMVAIQQPAADAPHGHPPDYYSLRFHYNPSAITMSPQFNPGVLNPVLQAGGPTAVGGLLVGTFMTWDMLFDRAYELAGIPGANYDPTDFNGPGYKGCLVDLGALLNLLGALDPKAPGLPQSQPVQVVFGRAPDGQKWGFTGFITQSDVNFLTFNKNMVPQRMTVNITLQATFIPSDQSGSDPASSGGNGSPPTVGALTAAGPLTAIGGSGFGTGAAGGFGSSGVF